MVCEIVSYGCRGSVKCFYKFWFVAQPRIARRHKFISWAGASRPERHWPRPNDPYLTYLFYCLSLPYFTTIPQRHPALATLPSWKELVIPRHSHHCTSLPPLGTSNRIQVICISIPSSSAPNNSIFQSTPLPSYSFSPIRGGSKSWLRVRKCSLRILRTLCSPFLAVRTLQLGDQVLYRVSV